MDLVYDPDFNIMKQSHNLCIAKRLAVICYYIVVKRTAEDGSGDLDKKKPRLEVLWLSDIILWWR